MSDEYMQQHRLLAGALELGEESLVMVRGMLYGWVADGVVAAGFWRAAAEALGGDGVFRFDFADLGDGELRDLEQFLRSADPGPARLWNDFGECVADELARRQVALDELVVLL